MEIIGVISGDGSLTCYNEEFQEYYHSLPGARQEALEKHVMPVIEYLKENKLINKKINVLDFCFGLGYNGYIFIEQMLKINPNAEINLIGLDNDQRIVDVAQEIFKDFINDITKKKNIRIQIIIGDAKETVKEIKQEIDVCFFDPFSPKKCPALWTREVFKDVYDKMSNKSILTTYSCAKAIRENMRISGFIVKDGPTIGRWCPATLGIKDG